jgi:uncharacterized metal-binding protein YceD (DUF177 family)
MIIRIKDIRREGLNVSEEMAPDILAKEEEAGIQFTAPIGVRAKLEKLDNTVLAHVNVKGKYLSFCARCLKDMEGDFEREFDLDFEITPTTETIDLGEDIRQEIILNVPFRLLCRDDCQGICPHCGGNRNTDKCHCAEVQSTEDEE